MAHHCPYFSVIIPVYNGGSAFKTCLQALYQSTFNDWELIVVDDGSTDGSDRMARQWDAKLFYTTGRAGPAAARNLGAHVARGRYLFFTDADCAVHSDTLHQMATIFQANPHLEAVFGSYDADPAAPNFIAQYKNLFHHYVHQTSYEQAVTFWTGCGAINRERFLALGGFDADRFRRPAIEDIDLGYRLTHQGGQIRLAKQVQVKHLKAWTFLGLLKSDIFDRGIPWTQLLWHYRAFSQDLNLQTHNRVSVIAVWLVVGCLLLQVSLPAGPLKRGLALLAGSCGLLLLWLNRDLYRFFRDHRGPGFMLRAIPLHWLYYFYNGLSFAGGMLALKWKG